jgi:predicted CoA-binding protein
MKSEPLWVEPTNDHLKEVLIQAKTVAIVGISANPSRPSNEIAKYLLENSKYEVFFVNPAISELFGKPVYPNLASIPSKIDIVDVFRKSSDLPSVFDAAIAIEPKNIWLQLGLSNPELARQAQSQGINVVMDRCIKIEHERLNVAD